MFGFWLLGSVSILTLMIMMISVIQTMFPGIVCFYRFIRWHLLSDLSSSAIRMASFIHNTKSIKTWPDPRIREINSCDCFDQKSTLIDPPYIKGHVDSKKTTAFRL